MNWRAPRAESIKRAIENNEQLVPDKNSEVIGFIHCGTHEDIIDGGLNSFITCFYIGPEFRNKGMDSELLDRATKDALDKGALGIESSTASLRVIGQWVLLGTRCGKIRAKFKKRLERPIRKQWHDRSIVHYVGPG